MKKISIIGFSFLSALAFATVVFFNSCTSDPCKDVTCLNGGTCVDGNCACSTGYEGTDCSTVSRDKFIKAWNSINNSCIGGQSSGTLTIATSGTGVLDMTLTNFGHFICGSGAVVVTATITGANTFEIASQPACGTTYSGTGTLSGNQLSISYTYNDPNYGSGSCTDTYN